LWQPKQNAEEWRSSEAQCLLSQYATKELGHDFYSWTASQLAVTSLQRLFFIVNAAKEKALA